MNANLGREDFGVPQFRCIEVKKEMVEEEELSLKFNEETQRFALAALEKGRVLLEKWESKRNTRPFEHISKMYENLESAMNWMNNRQSNSSVETVFVRTINDEETSDDFSSREMDDDGSNSDDSDDEVNVKGSNDPKIEAITKYKCPKKFECKICNKTFTNGHMQKSHMNKHLANDDPHKKKFQCDLCPKIYFDKNQLRNHKTSHLGKSSDDPRKKCEICGKTLSSADALASHKKRIHLANDDPRKKRYECESCNKIFWSSGDLRRHALTHLDDNDPHKKRFECDTCHKSFSKKDELRRHEKIHSDDIAEHKPYQCDICDQRFAGSGYLIVHKRKHLALGDPNKMMYKCEIDGCGREYVNPGSFSMHKRTHMNDEAKRLPHKCDICGKRFSTPYKLRLHKNHHLARDDPRRKKYECDVCGMKMSCLSKQEVMKRKPFQCDECDERFTSDVKLQFHKRTHSVNEQGRFECDVCGKSFSHNPTLKRHKKEKHDGKGKNMMQKHFENTKKSIEKSEELWTTDEDSSDIEESDDAN